MRRSKLLLGPLVIGVVLAVSALPASAHCSFGNLGSVPTNTDQTLTMEVPKEQGDEVFNADVRIAIPSGWTALSCPAKPDWTCTIVPGSPVSFHFASNGTSDRENFEFSVRAPNQVGDFKFPTLQKYNNGDQSDWIGNANDPNPAPTLKTTQGPPITVSPPTNPDKPTTTLAAPTTKPKAPITTTPITNPGGSPTTTAKPGVTTTVIPGAPTSTTTTSNPADPSGSTSVPEETTTTTVPGTIVTTTGTGTVPAPVAAEDGSGTVNAAGRPAASPSSGRGPLIGSVGVAALAGLAGVLILRRRNVVAGRTNDGEPTDLA